MVMAQLLAAFFIPAAVLPKLGADGRSEVVQSSGIARAKRENDSVNRTVDRSEPTASPTAASAEAVNPARYPSPAATCGMRRTQCTGVLRLHDAWNPEK